MEKILFVYDNMEEPNNATKKIIGRKKYAEIVLKKKTVYSRVLEALNEEKIFSDVTKIDSISDVKKTLELIKNENKEIRIIHMFSKFVICNHEEFKSLIEKVLYINENYLVQNNGDIAMLMYKDKRNYIELLENIIRDGQIDEETLKEQKPKIEDTSLLNISEYNNFLKYISGGFDSRYFNSLESSENLVIKSSTNKEKIKKEYMYYKLLPDDMKKWMIEPYDYKEEKDRASYTMERLYVPDIAIRWVHGAINEKELTNILNKTFYYLKNRKRKNISKDEFEKISNELYIKKVDKRIDQLKNCDKFDAIEEYIENGTEYESIDDIVLEYKKLYNKFTEKENKFISVIGHGDLCFSNMLYDDDINLLKLIDPKGATTEEELWTNPYYDIAKLSHSICGKYDFFNSGMYSISLDSDMKFKLNIEFDNQIYKKIFKEQLEKNNIDYEKIRVFEVSLFLSMLPLHMDYPKKVFGFILNAIDIINEIKQDELRKGK